MVLLKVLKLQACKYLTDSSLEPLYKDGALPTLRELDLSYGTLCQASIEELLACCTHLTHVSLNGCVNMHDLNWSFSVDRLYISTLPSEDVQPQRFLQYLNCVGCPNIKKVLIPSAARFSHLSSLNMPLSANLKEVDVACFNLCFLNLRCDFFPLLCDIILIVVDKERWENELVGRLGHQSKWVAFGICHVDMKYFLSEFSKYFANY